MKKLLILTLSICNLTACNVHIGLGSGVEAHRTIDITPEFTEVSTSAGIHVILTNSVHPEQAVISADEEVLPHVRVVQTNGSIHVRYENGVSINSSVPTVVKLPISTALKHIEASSSAEITCDDTLTGDEFLIEASSSADVDLNISARHVQVDVSSSAACHLSGEVDLCTAKASSSGGLEGFELTCHTADVKASSSGKIEITVTDILTAKASSSGDVRYKGNPATVNSDTSSAGSVKQK